MTQTQWKLEFEHNKDKHSIKNIYTSYIELKIWQSNFLHIEIFLYLYPIILRLPWHFIYWNIEVII